MSLSFPASPTTGQNFQQWSWDGHKWVPAVGSLQKGTRSLVSTQTVSTAVASVAFTGIDSSADEWVLEIINVKLSADQGIPQLRFSPDNGTTWDSTSNGYSYGFGTFYNSGASSYLNGVTSAIFLSVGQYVGARATFNGTIRLWRPYDTTINREVQFDTTGNLYSSGLLVRTVGSGNYNPVSNVTGMQFFFNAANIIAGTFNLYKINK